MGTRIRIGIMEIANFAISSQAANYSGPPLVHMNPSTVWTVKSDMKVGSVVQVVEAEDLSNTFLRFSISPQTFLRIDAATGNVTLTKPIAAKVTFLMIWSL